jgi:RNA polymerase sigma factor (sigma-70 family)
MQSDDVMSPGSRPGGVPRVMMSRVADVAQTYERFADELMRYATVLVGPGDAGDVVADAVLACCARPGWERVEHQRAYLYRAVLHRAASLRRSDERRHRRDHVAARGVSATDAGVDSADGAVDAERALARLSAQQRAVVYLAYWHDLPPSEIAQLLGVGEGTVRKQLARGRETLRRFLA